MAQKKDLAAIEEYQPVRCSKVTNVLLLFEKFHHLECELSDRLSPNTKLFSLLNVMHFKRRVKPLKGKGKTFASIYAQPRKKTFYPSSQDSR